MEQSIKEKIIRLSIAECEKRIAKLEVDIFANRIGDWMEFRKAAIDKAKTLECQVASEFLRKAAIEEKSLKNKIDLQIKNSTKWIDELVRLESELGTLISELSMIQFRNKPYQI